MSGQTSEKLSNSSKTAIGMPYLGYGTYQSSIEEVKAGVLEALRIGYRHIDTAEVYGNEEGVGQALKESGLPREEYFITTKVWPGYEAWNMPEKDYEGVLTVCKESLKKLGLDYVDLYLIHLPSSVKYRLEQWKALIELQKQGLVRHIGVSNYGIHHLQEIIQAKLPLPCVNQIELHPLQGQKKVLPFMKEHNILPIAYSSLAPLSTWRMEEGQGGDTTLERKAHANEILEKLATKYNVPQALVLLRWGLQRGFPILPKSSKAERMSQNYKVLDFELNGSDMEELNKLDSNIALAFTNPKLNPVEDLP